MSPYHQMAGLTWHEPVLTVWKTEHFSLIRTLSVTSPSSAISRVTHLCMEVMLHLLVSLTPTRRINTFTYKVSVTPSHKLKHPSANKAPFVTHHCTSLHTAATSQFYMGDSREILKIQTHMDHASTGNLTCCILIISCVVSFCTNYSTGSGECQSE